MTTEPTSTQSSIRSGVQPESEASIARMFDRVAPRYDFLNRLLSLSQDQRWRRHLVNHVPLRPEGALLDVATGTGDVLLAAMKSRPDYSRFVGVDISPQMLGLAKKKHLAEAAIRSDKRLVDFQTMSAESLAFPDESFDCVTISFGLRNVVDKPKALSEFHRVLRPGGVLLILEFFSPEHSKMAQAFQNYFHKILPTIGGLFSDRAAYEYLPASVEGFYKTEELRSLLDRMGLPVEDEESFLFGSVKLLMAWKHP